MHLEEEIRHNNGLLLLFDRSQQRTKVVVFRRDPDGWLFVVELSWGEVLLMGIEESKEDEGVLGGYRA